MGSPLFNIEISFRSHICSATSLTKTNELAAFADNETPIKALTAITAAISPDKTFFSFIFTNLH